MRAAWDWGAAEGMASITCSGTTASRNRSCCVSHQRKRSSGNTKRPARTGINAHDCFHSLRNPDCVRVLDDAGVSGYARRPSGAANSSVGNCEGNTPSAVITSSIVVGSPT